MNRTRFNVAVWGIGAMGCLIAGFLSSLLKDGNRDENLNLRLLIFGNWPEQVRALRQQGLRIIHRDHSETRHWLEIIDQPERLPEIDLCLIVVKSYQTETVAAQLARRLAQDGLAITLQNGLGNVELLQQTLGRERVALGVTELGATLLKPGRVRHGGDGRTYFARHQNRLIQVERAAAIFGEAGLAARVIDDAGGLLWGKLCVNAAINPLSAILGVPNGELLQHGVARELMFGAAAEAAALARAQRIHLPFADPVERVRQVCQATATNESSMLQDIKSGRPTEVEAITGAIVKVGHDRQIATPVNSGLYALIKKREQGQEIDGRSLEDVLRRDI